MKYENAPTSVGVVAPSQPGLVVVWLVVYLFSNCTVKVLCAPFVEAHDNAFYVVAHNDLYQGGRNALEERIGVMQGEMRNFETSSCAGVVQLIPSRKWRSSRKFASQVANLLTRFFLHTFFQTGCCLTFCCEESYGWDGA
eukprot:c9748_g1_i1 orf=338-757(+)